MNINDFTAAAIKGLDAGFSIKELQAALAEAEAEHNSNEVKAEAIAAARENAAGAIANYLTTIGAMPGNLFEVTKKEFIETMKAAFEV